MQRERILVVDDDEVVRESLIDELSDLYQVESACSGREALELLCAHRYDAVISDLRMPGVDGVEVLERAVEVDPEVVRILLTGYLDERGRVATIKPGAPFKIGKPWHDEIDVTLRRAFEYRATTRRLRGSVVDALAVAGVSDELGAADGLRSIASILVRRATEVHGVVSCGVVLVAGGEQRLLAGELPASDSACEWTESEPLVADGSARIVVTGDSDDAREIIRFLVDRGRTWSREDPGTKLARKALADGAAVERLTEVSRRATLGAMTASLVHEIASLVLCMDCWIMDLRDARSQLAHVPDAVQAVDELDAVVGRVHELFDSMRKFVRARSTERKMCDVDMMVRTAVALCGGYVKGHAELRVGPIPTARVLANEPLFLQVLVNLLRNAADASPEQGAIDLEVAVCDGRVEFRITDDGPGVPEELVATVFEPFVTTKSEDLGSGLGLAISLEIATDHGGVVHYRRVPGRGACFTLQVPAA